MNTTTATSGAALAIREFAADVRSALSDLGADEIDELTDGLEGDLTDQAEDSGGVWEPGSPEAYAEELRAAAGLPPRGEVRGGAPAAVATIRAAAMTLMVRLTSNRFVTACLAFLVSIRPVWWFLRGIAIFVAVLAFVSPQTLHWNMLANSTWMLAVPAVVLSVQWGRGRWLPRTWLPFASVLVNVAALVALPFIGSAAATTINNAAWNAEYVSSTGSGYFPTERIMVNGVPVTNIFPYDENGEPLTDVQLFDQDGNPLLAANDHADWLTVYSESVFALVPSSRVPGNAGWNVFPLKAILDPDVGYDGPIEPAEAPFPLVRPLAVDPDAIPVPTPSPTVEPTP
ncbi:MAG: hypothetical protein ACOH19_10185 [Rhodoglobus sp.]